MAFASAMGCGGGACGGCEGIEPIPGGFPADQRSDNAVQVRVTSSALSTLSQDPATLVQGLLGGPLSINVPGSCGSDPEICCDGGVPAATCGPINIDLSLRPGDDARLVLDPVEGQKRLTVTLRARVQTAMDLPVKAFGISCGAELNTANGDNDDLEIVVPVNFEPQHASGTRIVVGDIVINRLDDEDIDLNGNFLCDAASWGVQFFTGTLKDTFSEQIKNAIQGQTCKACETGDVAECGPFASACTDGTCMQGDQCLQELGIVGRIRAGALLGDLSPGTQGAFDLYEVAGGHAESNTDGLALGLRGGMLPSGAPRDRCGPPATAPTRPAITPSVFFAANTRPDTGEAFDIGIGIHASQLAQFAYAAYDGGFLCLTIGARTVAQLSTGTLVLLSESLGNLVEMSSPMAVGLRPQAPPVITLGKNTETEPLLTLGFQQIEIDFFAAIDGQYTRVFTAVADIALPIGLQVTDTGELAPTIGDVSQAFTNISVKNSEALTESPEQIAAVLPTLLELVLPALGDSLGTIALPSFGGLTIAVTAVTAVPQALNGTDNSYLAIYGNLAPAAMPRPVQTRATISAQTDIPPALVTKATEWSRAPAPSVTLALGAEGATHYEWSYRLDGGFWSRWSAAPVQTISTRSFWLGGDHEVDVRARATGDVGTVDPTPERLAFTFHGVANTRVAPPFHGQPSEAGCNCDTNGGAGASPLLALGLGALLLRRRRRKHLQTLAFAVAVGAMPACDCGGSDANQCGDVECKPGEIAPTSLGRWTSLAADSDRVLVATYDQGLGDVVVIDVTNPDDQKMTVVAGIPEDVAPTYDPATYRGGIEGAGPNVGAWTSIAMHDGRAAVAYQNRETHSLEIAFEDDAGNWTHESVDTDGTEVGRHASLTYADGAAAIAYLSENIDNGSGSIITELRLARRSGGSWTTSVIVSGAGTCGGYCTAGTVCIAGMMGETCAAVTSDCMGACGDGEECVAGTCTALIEMSPVESLGSGTGLYVSLVALPDGRLAAAYYDMNARALKLAVETGVGTSEFTEQTLHEGTGDRGLWASAAVDDSGTIHIAYQDAIGDQLMYTTWAGSPGTPEVVDDGQRPGDRTHTVGAGAAMFLSNGTPMIAYQDGLTADVYLATKSGTWTTAPVAPGLSLDGFHIGASGARDGIPYVAWDRIDNAKTPPHTLAVETP